MDKTKPSWGKCALVLRILSLGALALGFGLVAWALMNIGAESVPSAEAYSDLPSSSTTVAVSQVGSAGNQAAPDPAEAYSDLPSTSTTVAVSQVGSAGNQVAPDSKEGDRIGSLSIPVLKQKWPIIQGTGTDALKKGVGHFIQSVLPGEEDNCVLSGHRTTVFARLGELEAGDQLIVQTSTGTYTYQVMGIRIVHKDDRTVIVHTDHAVLTLTTCYPFHYIGSAPDRYIVSADLVARQ